jgi:hypothetical protein
VKGPPKLVVKPMSTLKTVAPMAVVAASSSMGETDWIVLSTADAWDSPRWVTEFLKGLKNMEADWEGICNTLCYGFANHLLITFISSLTTHQIID